MDSEGYGKDGEEGDNWLPAQSLEEEAGGENHAGGTSESSEEPEVGEEGELREERAEEVTA